LFCLVRGRSFIEEPVEPDGSTGSTTFRIAERRDLANLVGIGETSADADKATTDGDLDVANNWSTVETDASEVSVVLDVALAVPNDFHESAICPPETKVEVVREPS
jgi:hypothetical protein